MPTLALIDYGSGNLASAARALSAAAQASGIAMDVVVTDNPDDVAAAERIVLPGQGAFDQCMQGLLARPHLREGLEYAVRRQGKPFLGICVGMQLLAEIGREHGDHAGLGWIGGVCEPLETAERLPHMGWNRVMAARPHPVLAPLGPTGAHLYFAHSFVVRPPTDDATVATCDHGAPFSAAIAKDAMIGVQFHPEKSQAVGLAILQRFLEWRP